MGRPAGENLPRNLPEKLDVDDDPRQDALGRLIGQLFQTTLADEKHADRSEASVARSTVLGVIAVVKKAIGESTVAEYQALCRGVLVRVSKGRRVPRWDAFYEDNTAKEIRESALVRLALHLERCAPSADAFAKLVDVDATRGQG